MKTITFNLTKSVRLTPVTGETHVSVVTSGDFIRTDAETSKSPRIREVILSETDNGKLTRTPKGLKRSVHITLPVMEASKEEFHRQVDELFARAGLSHSGTSVPCS